MKTLIAVVAVAVVVTVFGVLVVPFLVAGVVADQVQQAEQLAAEWDIPPQIVPALQDAGQRAGISWFLLAGVASAATDFARHAPDGVERGLALGSALFPVVVPPIGAAGGGVGMFLVTPAPALTDPQDVLEAAVWLAGQLAQLARQAGLSPGSFGQPQVSGLWQQVVAGAPLLISSPATNDAAGLTPASPGSNPIQQFGAAVLARIGAPTTADNLGAFSAWAAGEGTCARYNPLATTQPEAGATPFNTLSDGGHVWNYPSFDTGVAATTTALTNGLYRSVIAAFQASAGEAAVAAAVESSPWGTRHFGSTTYAGRSCGGTIGAPSSLPTVSGPDAVAATIVARALRYDDIWSQLSALSPSPS